MHDGAAQPRAADTAMADSARPQDVRGAVSRRVVPLALSDDDEDDSSSTLAFGFVDYTAAASLDAAATALSKAPPPAAAAGGSKKRRGGGGSKGRRQWCSKDFNTELGVYTCSTDGHYYVRLDVAPPPAATPPLFFTLVLRHTLGGTSHEHAAPGSSGCSTGKLFWLRRGDQVSARATHASAGVVVAPVALRALEAGLAATLNVELCMRKRKRGDEFREEDDDPDSETTAAAAAIASGKAVKGRRRREKKLRARKQAAAATAAVAAEQPSDDVDGDSSGTGSDTEWEEGFESSDSAFCT